MVGKAYSASFAKSQFHCNATPVRPRYRGLTPEELGILFGLGNAARLIAGPLVNRIADLFGALRASPWRSAPGSRLRRRLGWLPCKASFSCWSSIWRSQRGWVAEIADLGDDDGIVLGLQRPLEDQLGIADAIAVSNTRAPMSSAMASAVCDLVSSTSPQNVAVSRQRGARRRPGADPDARYRATVAWLHHVCAASLSQQRRLAWWARSRISSREMPASASVRSESHLKLTSVWR